MTHKGKTTEVTKARAEIFFQDAKGHLEGANYKLNRSEWNHAASYAILGMISASSALTGALFGVRSSDPDHRVVAELIKSKASGKDRDEWVRQAERIKETVARKSLIAYEGRQTLEAEARDIVKRADRFIDFVRICLKK